MKCHMILLAGGSGKRMGSEMPKQFMEVAGKPLIQHSLETIERSSWIDDCVLVAARKDLEYMRQKILTQCEHSKVIALATGGRERYESVLNGIKKLQSLSVEVTPYDVIMIHDGARPFLTEKMIRDCRDGAAEYGACVAAVRTKDTVAVSDGNLFEAEVPPRENVWLIQTPQAFWAGEVYKAFGRLEQELSADDGERKLSWVTDDAAVVKHYNGTRIRLVEGDYRNLKVTTPEDIFLAESLINQEK